MPPRTDTTTQLPNGALQTTFSVNPQPSGMYLGPFTILVCLYDNKDEFEPAQPPMRTRRRQPAAVTAVQDAPDAPIPRGRGRGRGRSRGSTNAGRGQSAPARTLNQGKECNLLHKLF